jgi:hypothetical protein
MASDEKILLTRIGNETVMAEFALFPDIHVKALRIP